ncbi:MAG: ribose-5-phosphate isomerase RpiA [Parvularculales bacterium]
MSEALSLKKKVAAHSMDLVEEGMVLGLGTGTTMRWFIEYLGEKVTKGGMKVQGVATSEGTAHLAEQAGIPLIAPEDMPSLDLAVDGTDEIDSDLRLIKGGGGALLREKIVANAALSFVVIADESKLVDRLGRFPLPVEVDRFCAVATARAIQICLKELNLPDKVALRKREDNRPYITDGGNHIYDCYVNEITSPASLAVSLDAIPGVLGHGLFIGMVAKAMIANAEGIHIMEAQQ